MSQYNEKKNQTAKAAARTGAPAEPKETTRRAVPGKSNPDETLSEGRSRLQPVRDNSKARLGENAVVLITGSSSGIGLALARQLLAAGCRVYGVARRYSENENWQPDEMGLVQIKLDVTNADSCQQAVAKIISKEGRLDAVFFNAGYGVAGAVEETSAKQAVSQMLANVIGISAFLPEVIRQMRQQGSGSLIFVGSMTSVLPIPFQAYYSASKAALEALALALRDEIKPYNVRCMVVNPGDTKSDFAQSRKKVIIPENSVYHKRFKRSVLKMERDENEGMSSEKLASLMIRQVQKNTLPLVYTPGLLYKTAVILKRILPLRLVRFVIGRMYSR